MATFESDESGVGEEYAPGVTCTRYRHGTQPEYVRACDVEIVPSLQEYARLHRL